MPVVAQQLKARLPKATLAAAPAPVRNKFRRLSRYCTMASKCGLADRFESSSLKWLRDVWGSDCMGLGPQVDDNSLSR